MSAPRQSPARLVLGVDGGNSKVDVVLADGDGKILAARRGPTISHQVVPLELAMDRLRGLIGAVREAAGLTPDQLPDVLVAALAGADYPSDVRLLQDAISGLGEARRSVVVNDTIGALRAGSESGWGVGLVCGQGINAAAVSPSGRQLRFSGVGDFAGDWGGGGGVGRAGLAAAVRGSDGRGPRTSLERAVPAFFGLRRPATVTRALYFGTIPESRLNELSPVVFGAAAAGDQVAREIIDRLADELAGMAGALIRRLHMTRAEVEVVLAGGVFRTTDAAFYDRLESRIHDAAGRGRLVRLACPPVAGAVLLALDDQSSSAGSGRTDVRRGPSGTRRPEGLGHQGCRFGLTE